MEGFSGTTKITKNTKELISGSFLCDLSVFYG